MFLNNLSVGGSHERWAPPTQTSRITPCGGWEIAQTGYVPPSANMSSGSEYLTRLLLAPNGSQETETAEGDFGVRIPIRSPMRIAANEWRVRPRGFSESRYIFGTSMCKMHHEWPRQSKWCSESGYLIGTSIRIKARIRPRKPKGFLESEYLFGPSMRITPHEWKGSPEDVFGVRISVRHFEGWLDKGAAP